LKNIKTIIRATAASHVGNIRGNNEDNFFLNGKSLGLSIEGIATESDVSSGGLYAVCDGMGGEESGEVASKIAVDTLQEYHAQTLENETTFNKIMRSYVDEANTRICAEIEKNGGKRMGTTLASLYINDGVAHVCNLGDSRVYLIRNGEIIQLSQDHTQVKRLIDMGILDNKSAKTHPERHKLTQHLGIFPKELIIEPFYADKIHLEDGDVFILCSDGLTDMLDNSEIEMALNLYSDPKSVAEKLVELALENGGRDNVTVIVANVEKAKSSHAKIVIPIILGILVLSVAAFVIVNQLIRTPANLPEYTPDYPYSVGNEHGVGNDVATGEIQQAEPTVTFSNIKNEWQAHDTGVEWIKTLSVEIENARGYEIERIELTLTGSDADNIIFHVTYDEFENPAEIFTFSHEVVRILVDDGNIEIMAYGIEDNYELRPGETYHWWVIVILDNGRKYQTPLRPFVFTKP